MAKRLRIAFLLLVLLGVSLSAWLKHGRIVSWQGTLYVAAYPINADGSSASEQYIRTLQESDLEPVATFIATEAKRHGINTLYPVKITLGPEIKSLPPEEPTQRSALAAISWSLRMRYWAWHNTPATDFKPEVRLYLLYCDPARNNTVPDSTGLAKGQIGLAYLFASQAQHGSNLVVVTHEFLHTLGATDKYDLATGRPIFPNGYAEPERNPRTPQRYAEIMAGRIPQDAGSAVIPANLGETLIGQDTAAEIGWGIRRPQ